jgi:hypothetical protein
VLAQRSVDGAYLRVFNRKQLDDEWELHVDNEFASGLFSAFKASDSFHVSEARASSHLCSQCQTIRDGLWLPGFNITYNTPTLAGRSASKECDLCSLLWRTCERYGGTVYRTVKFDRVGSLLKMNGSGVPVLSICRSPSEFTPRCCHYRTFGSLLTPENQI